MDNLILLSKIESLKRCIDRIKSKTPDSIDELTSDLDRQDIIVLNLERSVQICVDIAALIIAEEDIQTPMSMSESFESLKGIKVIDAALTERIKKSLGFRNIAVHEYKNIDWQIVYSIIRENLGDFQQYARQIMLWLEKK
jgi:uncharacterized protein YutE (UPF0331/DUF86 family)